MATSKLAPTRGPRSSVRGAEHRFVATVLIPTVIFYGLFRLYPVAFAFYMSLHDWKLLRAQQLFIGIGNYQTILSDPLFIKVIGNTFYFAVAATLLGTIAALFLAILINPVQRGSTLLRL